MYLGPYTLNIDETNQLQVKVNILGNTILLNIIRSMYYNVYVYVPTCGSIYLASTVYRRAGVNTRFYGGGAEFDEREKKSRPSYCVFLMEEEEIEVR